MSQGAVRTPQGGQTGGACGHSRGLRQAGHSLSQTPAAWSIPTAATGIMQSKIQAGRRGGSKTVEVSARPKSGGRTSRGWSRRGTQVVPEGMENPTARREVEGLLRQTPTARNTQCMVLEKHEVCGEPSRPPALPGIHTHAARQVRPCCSLVLLQATQKPGRRPWSTGQLLSGLRRKRTADGEATEPPWETRPRRAQPAHQDGRAQLIQVGAG